MLAALRLLMTWISFVVLMLFCTQQALAGGVRVIQNPNFDIRRDTTPVTIPTPSGDTWYYWGDDTCVSRGSPNSCMGSGQSGEVHFCVRILP